MIIMIKTDKQLKIPKWSKNEINRWADYIELRCLYMDDHWFLKTMCLIYLLMKI